MKKRVKRGSSPIDDGAATDESVVEADAAALLELPSRRKRSLRVGVILDDSWERHRGLLEALRRRAKLVLFVRDAVAVELDTGAALTFSTRAELHELLLQRPARDLFLDLRSTTAAKQLAIWRVAYFHVREGGVYAHLRPEAQGFSGWTEKVALLAGEQKAKGEDFTELAESTRRVRVVELHMGEMVSYRKDLQHIYQMHDSDAATLAPRRLPGLDVDLLGSVPTATVVSGATVHHHGAAKEMIGFDDVFTVPELHIWHYRGKIALDSHMLTYRGATALPPSFRFPDQPRLLSPRVRRVADDWARLPPTVERPAVTLEGDYFDFNAGYPSMFGHVLTQSVHKLWAWDEAKRRLPDLKALAYIREGHEPTVERALLNAYGIEDDDIYFTSEPVFLQSYVSPTIIWQYARPCYASPLALDVWRRIGRGLGVRDVVPRERLFISRRDASSIHRACRNTSEVEEVFRDHGFTIVYPEEHPLAEQARIFSGAKVLAGFGGSGMFNMMYGAPEHVIVLNHDGYRVRNEHLYTALLGGTADYFWSAADIPHPEGSYTKEAFASPWRFDFERNGRALNELLAALS